MSSRNPISNIRSASSSTTEWQVDKSKTFLSIKSRSLPGVPITNDTPLFISPICRIIGSPPTQATENIPKLKARFLKSFSIWRANSRVGAIISTISLFAWPLVFAIFSINGRRKAAVLPVPVLAMPKTSRPFSTEGIAWSWIGRG